MQSSRLRNRLVLLVALAIAPLWSFAGSMEEGITRYESGDLQGARTAFAQALEQQPGNAKAAFMLGRTHLDENQPKKAVRWFERATEIEPESSHYHQYLGEALGRWMSEASTLTRMRKGGEVRKAFARAVELDPKNLGARMGLVTFYLNAPAIGGGGRDKAEQEARGIAALDVLAGHEAWLQIYLHEKEYGDALLELDAITRIDPGNENALLMRGILLTRQEQFEAAAAHFSDWLEKEPEQMAAAYQLGRVSALSGVNPEQGEAALLRYLQHQPSRSDPPLAWAHFRLGQIYEHMARFDAARKSYRAALDADHGHTEARKALKKLPD